MVDWVFLITLFQAIESVFFTVVASPNLPVHICSEERADEVYSKHAGTELLGVRFIPKSELLISPSISNIFKQTGNENIEIHQIGDIALMHQPVKKIFIC